MARRKKYDPQDLHRSVFAGDNLDVLRGIDSNSIDLIYLDPPFNSNKTYSAPIGSAAAGAAFKDAWTLSDVDLIEHNRIKREHEWLYALIYAARKTHSKGMFSYLLMMASRLFELHRVLKDTGSIYLHCDPTASHYLKLVMDGIFGSTNFRNDISWERTKRGFKGSQYKAKHFQNNSDSILFYAKNKDCFFNESGALLPFEEDELKQYRKSDSKGIYYYDTAHNRQSAASRPNLCYEFKGIYPPYESGWKTGLERMMELYKNGDLELRQDTWYRKIRPKPGKLVSDIWTDISGVGASDERTGYPTQKPLSLLERIIKASSKEGDLILDPFCGCATTMVAAEMLDRKWCGIDLSALAAELVVQRIRKYDNLFTKKDVKISKGIPVRTDIKREMADTTAKKIALRESLFTLQEGLCNLCHYEFPEPRHLHLDHIFPRSKGGQDWVDNFQLLCGSCNSIKGGKTQEEAQARLAEIRGINFDPFTK